MIDKIKSGVRAGTYNVSKPRTRFFAKAKAAASESDCFGVETGLYENCI